MSVPTPVIKQGWLRAAAFFVAYTGLAVLAGKLLDQLVTGEGINTLYAALVASFVLSAGLVYLFRKFVDRRDIKSLGLDPNAGRRDGAIGFLVAPVLLGMGSLVLYLHHNVEWTEINFNSDLLFYCVLIVLASAGEELAFRGYILNNLMDSLDKWMALFVSAVLFAFMHGSNPHMSVVAFLNLFLGGLLLGLNYVFTRNLWYSILLHVSWNIFQGPVLGYPVSGISLPSLLVLESSGDPLLTGGSFGFEGSFIDSLLTLIAILLLYLGFNGNLRPKAKAGDAGK